MEQPNIKPIRESGDLYQLVEPYYIDLRPFNVNKRFTIAAGFEYDGATVPRWFWSLSGISRDGIHRAAALVHDYLYSVKGFQGQPHRGNEITRDEVDKIFKRMLKEVGVASHRVFLAYWGARIGGRFYWKD